MANRGAGSPGNRPTDTRPGVADLRGGTGYRGDADDPDDELHSQPGSTRDHPGPQHGPAGLVSLRRPEHDGDDQRDQRRADRQYARADFRDRAVFGLPNSALAVRRKVILM